MPLAALALWTCAKTDNAPASGAGTRIAILPFENLTGDASLDWLGASVQAALANQLATANDVNVFPALAWRDAFEQRAGKVVSGLVDRAPGGALRLRAVVDDASRNKAAAEFDERRPADSFLTAIAVLAKQISPQARPPLTSNWKAFSALGQAQRATTIEERRRLTEEAIAADASYAPAYLALAELSLAARDADGARAALNRLMARNPPPLEAARARAALAGLSEDVQARVISLDELAKASPANAALQFNAGSALIAAKEFKAGVQALERGLKIDAGNGNMWNALAYAKSYLGDVAGARAAIEKYASVAPGPNNLDSRAEIEYQAGRFAEAQRMFVENHRKNPQFLGGVSLLKAAYAAFRASGVAAADPLWTEFFQSIPGTEPNLRALALEVDWFAATNRVDQAIAKARAGLNGSDRVTQAVMATHLCGYELVAGRRAEATAAARTAMTAVPNHPVAAICFFAAQPSTTDVEWAARANRMFGGSGPGVVAIRRQALAYALFFDRHYAAAETLLRDLYRQAPAESEGEMRVLLAASLKAQEKTAEARQLMGFWPLPPSQDGLFQAWVFRQTGELMTALKQPGA